jgi:hypothetical protein
MDVTLSIIIEHAKQSDEIVWPYSMNDWKTAVKWVVLITTRWSRRGRRKKERKKGRGRDEIQEDEDLHINGNYTLNSFRKIGIWRTEAGWTVYCVNWRQQTHEGITGRRKKETGSQIYYQWARKSRFLNDILLICVGLCIIWAYSTFCCLATEHKSQV